MLGIHKYILIDKTVILIMNSAIFLFKYKSLVAKGCVWVSGLICSRAMNLDQPWNSISMCNIMYMLYIMYILWLYGFHRTRTLLVSLGWPIHHWKSTYLLHNRLKKIKFKCTRQHVSWYIELKTNLQCRYTRAAQVTQLFPQSHSRSAIFTSD